MGITWNTVRLLMLLLVWVVFALVGVGCGHSPTGPSPMSQSPISPSSTPNPSPAPTPTGGWTDTLAESRRVCTTHCHLETYNATMQRVPEPSIFVCRVIEQFRPHVR